jgi:hypothetical protein
MAFAGLSLQAADQELVKQLLCEAHAQARACPLAWCALACHGVHLRHVLYCVAAALVQVCMEDMPELTPAQHNALKQRCVRGHYPTLQPAFCVAGVAAVSPHYKLP